MFRGLYYGSYKAPRESHMDYRYAHLHHDDGRGVSWVMFCLGGKCRSTARPLSQACSARSHSWVKVCKHCLLGAGAVGQPALNRFFSLHYLLPFIIAGLVIVHIWAFHSTGNNNPTGVEVRRGSVADAKKDTLPFWPYFVIKDLFALAVILAVFMAVVGFMPNYLGHPDNYIPANALATPSHIVPEWYFLPFYAILRAFTADVWVVQIVNFLSFGIIDAKFFGVLAMFGAICCDGAGALVGHVIGAFRPLPPDVQVVVRAAGSRLSLS